MSLVNLLVATRDSFADWRRKRRAYAELMALDDRLLADIGIHRSEISRIVWGQPESGEGFFDERRPQHEFSDEPPCLSPPSFPIPRPF
jgi:uncharacterized protein YjiS (DUF1127 family)